MDNAPIPKDMDEEHNGPAPLENRIALLEESVQRINEFNREVTSALTHALARLKDLEPMTGWAARFEQKFENYRRAETLARASRIYPKTRTVVFVGMGYFGDNAKYAYLAFCNYARDKNITVRYLTDDPAQYALLTSNGFPCLPCEPDDWTIKDIQILLGAKTVVLSDNFHPYSMRSSKAYGMLQGAKTLQLWHGIPVKNIGLRYLLRADNVLLDELIASSGSFDVFVGPGEEMENEWAQMFAFGEFAALGYPRNDVLFRELTAHDRLNTDADTLALFETAKDNDSPIILYTPTYRDDEAFGWFGKSGVVALSEHARAQGYTFAINLHPYEQHAIEQFRQRYPGIHFVAPGTDIYPVLKYTDMLITDYSSLAFDYLLLDRPLVFFRPDHQYYMTKERGLIPGRERLTPGAVTSNVDELIRAVDSAVNFARAPATDPSRIARHHLRGKLFDHLDGNAAARICEWIEALVEDE